MFDMKIPELKNILFTTTLSVRIYDVNYGNHLGHDSLISLLHEARMRFLKSMGYSEIDIQQVGILITSLAVNYLSEAFFADNLVINIGIGEKTRTSLELLYQVINENSKKIVANAITTITFYDYRNKKVSKIPEEFMVRVDS